AGGDPHRTKVQQDGTTRSETALATMATANPVDTRIPQSARKQERPSPTSMTWWAPCGRSSRVRRQLSTEIQRPQSTKARHTAAITARTGFSADQPGGGV